MGLRTVPALSLSWPLKIKMRSPWGVRFHNGEIFDAEIVRLNWEENLRLRQPHVLGEFMNFKPGSRLEIVDPQTVRFIFPEPDGGVLPKLSVMHIANRQFYQDFGWGEKNW